MNYKITKATNEDLKSILSIISYAIAGMRRQGIDQWDEIYPDQTKILGDITEGTAYTMWAEDQIVAYMVLNETQSPEYQKCNWTKNTGIPLIIHRLCVHEKMQGKGIASTMIQWAEKFAKEHQYSSIRLDAFLKNPAAIYLYEKLGYLKTGIVTFRKGDFNCYEKTII